MIAVLAETTGAALLNGLLRRFNTRNVAATKPERRAASRSMGRMYDGYETVAKKQGIKKPSEIDLEQNVPPSDLNMGDDISIYASNSINRDTGNPAIQINPNADEVNLAHELGHVISRQTPIGETVRTLRDNPQLKQALLGAMVTVPGFAAALEQGDDDMDTSIALALATQAPAIIDETAANINAVRVMNNAGKRGIKGGQLGRMAGGYLSYLAAPILAAAAGNVVGNQLD